MPRHAECPLILLAALALSACALDDVDDSVTDTRVAFGDRDALLPEEEFPQVRANCALPGAVLTRHGTGWRLILPSQVYASRKSQPTAGRIACITSWAQGRGLALAIVDAR